jgi:hypothetical protein
VLAPGDHFALALVLEEESQRVDEEQIFFVVPARAQLVREEAQLFRVRIEDRQRLQERLRRPVQGEQFLALGLARESGLGARLALQDMDARGLFARFIDDQDEVFPA